MALKVIRRKGFSGVIYYVPHPWELLIWDHLLMVLEVVNWGGLRGVGGRGGRVKNFCTHERLIWANPENLVKIRPMVKEVLKGGEGL